jgi:hypothetical protein
MPDLRHTRILRAPSIIALLLLWVAGSGGQEPSVDRSPTSSPGRVGSQEPKVVLLGDGRIVEGVVSEDDGFVVVTQPVGSMRFPGKQVERVFDSLAEVYQYKLEQLPEEDFDERLKLARWCLTQNMQAEARQQLQAILEVSPKHPQAKAMLIALDQAQARLALRQRRDPEIQQTAGEEAEKPRAERPAVLDAAVIEGARRGLGIAETPVIFDLPPAVAVQRANQFARFVHPVLQTYCARCHNERYDGRFQLVEVRTRHDRTPQTLRANLDATLKLVDRDNPAHSELLASSLRPHGRSNKPRPIFAGSNDRAYQILAAWVSSLRAKPPTDAGLSRGGSVESDEEGFAVDRTRIGTGAAPGISAASPPTNPPNLAVEPAVLPPTRFEPGKGLQVEAEVDPSEFPLPFAVSGVRPPIAAPASATPQEAKQRPAGSLPADRAPASPPGTKVGDPKAPSVPRGPSSASSDPASATETAAATEKPRKPLKLDPTLLQRALQLRNQNRP